MNTLVISSSAGKLLWPAGLFFLTLASGFWLSNSGKPYSSLFFNTHKMIAVGSILFLLVYIVRLSRGVGFPSTVALVAVILSGLLLLALIATGGMLILDIELSGLPLLVHQIAPLLAVIVSLAAVCLLLQGSH